MHSRSLVLVLGLLALSACTDDAVAPTSSASQLGLAASVSSHGHLVLHVDSAAAPGGDGSGERPYQNLRDAVDFLNQNGGGKIIVSPGTYPVTETIKIESPVTILGSNEMAFDSTGLPTGVITPGTESRIVGTPGTAADTMLLVRRDDGGIIHGVKLANMTIEAVTGTVASILLTKTQDFDVHNNLLKGPSANLVASASSGQIRGNYFTGAVCGMCIGGGNPASPSVIDIRNNRALANRSGSIFLNGSGTDVEEFADQLDATIENNDLSDNVAANKTGFGIRIFIIARQPGLPVDSQYTGHVRAVVRNNRIANNEFGLILDAGFPYRRFNGVCDSRTYSGHIDLTLNANAITGSTRNAALITFTRSTAALNTAQLPLWQYLHNSTFTVSDPDGSIAGYQLVHRVNDPTIPAPQCPNDLSSEPLGNHFLYNGAEVAAN